jgi:hypothetical protein
MSRKLRYTLIAIGFCLFLILAPAIVLYVRGINFDFAKGEFVQTGILALRAEPKDAQVFLDGKLAATSVADIKFLIPQEYNVTLQKPGYQTWEKRLSVLGGQVTWGSPVAGKVFMFKSEPAASVAATQARNFAVMPNKNTIAFLLPKSLNLVSLQDTNSGSTIVLPKPATSLLPSADGSQFILQNETATSSTVLYVNAGRRTVTDLSGLFKTGSRWYFSASGKLYTLSDGTFFAVSPDTGATTLLQSRVLAAAFLNDDLYLLKQKNGSWRIQETPDPAQEGQDILKDLPQFTQAELVVSFEKQAYLIADNTLYKVGSRLDPVASNLTAWDFNSGDSALVYLHSGELDYINPFSNETNFITRHSDAVTQPTLRFGLSNVFFVENNTIKALELDTRGHQNEYGLYKGADIKKFALDGDGKILVVLDGDELKTVIIR